MNNHINTVHKKLKNFKCTSCDKSFTENGNLKRHVTTLHGKEKNKHYKCFQCDKSYAWKGDFVQHVKVVHEEKRYICNLCDKAFSLRWELDKHKKVHGKQLKTFGLKKIPKDVKCMSHIKLIKSPM